MGLAEGLRMKRRIAIAAEALARVTTTAMKINLSGLAPNLHHLHHKRKSLKVLAPPPHAQ